jgi:hypothetical protein
MNPSGRLKKAAKDYLSGEKPQGWNSKRAKKNKVTDFGDSVPWATASALRASSLIPLARVKARTSKCRGPVSPWTPGNLIRTGV